MRTNKKLSSILFYILTLCILLCGCGNKNPVTPEEKVSSSGVIKGNIVDIIGKVKAKGLEGVNVCIEGKNLCDTTDKDGYFEILNVPAGRQVIRAEIGGYKTAFQIVDLKKDEVKDVGGIKAINCGQITGIASDIETKKPIENVKITALISNYSSESKPDNPNIPHITKTNGMGQYSILVPAGYYLVTTMKDGYAQDSREILVNELSTAPCDFQLTPKDENKGEVKGEVKAVLSDGTIVPVPYATILIENEANSYFAMSDLNGEYSITDIIPGEYKATAESSGYGKQEKEKVMVEAGKTTQLNFELKSIIAEVSGVVISAVDNQPIKYAKISLYNEYWILPIDPVILKSKKQKTEKIIPFPDYVLAITDENGKYSFTIPQGTYTFICRKPGYLDQKKEITLQKGSNTLDFQLTPKAEVKLYGYVTEDTGLLTVWIPIAGAKISLYPLILPCVSGAFCSNSKINDLVPVYTAKTDEKGYYEIQNIKSGEYSAIVEKEGYETKYEIIIVDAVDTKINFQLKKIENIYGSIEGRVTQADVDCGNNADCIVPIKDVKIFFYQEMPILESKENKKELCISADTVNCISPIPLMTDENGYYKIENLNQGEYTVHTHKEGYEKAKKDCEVSVGQSTTVNFGLRKIKECSCKNLCGDGICQEVVCLACGCPCGETSETCPQDCN